MEWEEWRPIYHGITRRLGLDEAADREATRMLTELLSSVDPSPLLKQLRDILQDRIVVVFGAGPSLERHIEKIRSDRLYDDASYVAADGAVEAILRETGRCDVLVTDLDGLRRHLSYYDQIGVLSVVHAHGDNMALLKSMIPGTSSVLGSTQTEPTDRAFLWGGFTDGDRACYLVTHYSPKRVVLAGMDFGSIVGRWSKPHYTSDHIADVRKRAKLEIGMELLERLMAETAISLSVLT